MGYYNTAQICLNGHIISRRINGNSSLMEKFCTKCGAETICNCLNCGEKIRGKYEVERVIDLTTDKSPAPLYCHNCGNPYPWTEDALEAARMVIDEEERFSTSDRENLKKSLPDLLSDTPRTTLATLRFKKAMSVVGKTTKEALMKFVVSLACDAAKSQLGL